MFLEKKRIAGLGVFLGPEFVSQVCFVWPRRQRGQSVVVPVANNRAACDWQVNSRSPPGTADVIGALVEVW